MNNIGLLLLTVDNPYFEDNIKQFINSNIKLYIHAKYPEKLSPFLKKYIIKDLIETAWGDISLVDASINLLKSSFNDCDYFYLLSGDTFIINELKFCEIG